VAVINRQESFIIDNKVKEIVKKYPHALYYPFKVVESNITVNLHDNQVQPTRLFNKIQDFYKKRYSNLDAWTLALDGLVHPE
jgi:HSP90 family molecular chaperone